MLVFLTGGTGFIGHYVAHELLNAGHSLRILARNSQKIPSLAKHPKVQMVLGELSHTDTIEKALKGCNACIHVALGWGETPTTMLQNDTMATVFLLEAAHRCGVERFIYTSSTAAMGEMRSPMHSELCNRPIDLYGATKAASEAFVLGFPASPMACNIIRPGYTFGNPACLDGVTQPDARFRSIARAIRQGQDITLIRHDGTQFIDGASMGIIYRALLESEAQRTILLALGRDWVSWEEIANMGLDIYGSSSSRIVLEDRGWGDSPILFDVSGIQNLFGFSLDPRPALREHMRWCLENT